MKTTAVVNNWNNVWACVEESEAKYRLLSPKFHACYLFLIKQMSGCFSMVDFLFFCSCIENCEPHKYGVHKFQCWKKGWGNWGTKQLANYSERNYACMFEAKYIIFDWQQDVLQGRYANKVSNILFINCSIEKCFSSAVCYDVKLAVGIYGLIETVWSLGHQMGGQWLSLGIITWLCGFWREIT